MRYRLQTLLIVLALGPPVLAGAWWGWKAYERYRNEQMIQRILDSLDDEFIETT
jgi:hypothetical protein